MCGGYDNNQLGLGLGLWLDVDCVATSFVEVMAVVEVMEDNNPYPTPDELPTLS